MMPIHQSPNSPNTTHLLSETQSRLQGGHPGLPGFTGMCVCLFFQTAVLVFTMCARVMAFVASCGILVVHPHSKAVYHILNSALKKCSSRNSYDEMQVIG